MKLLNATLLIILLLFTLFEFQFYTKSTFHYQIDGLPVNKKYF